MTELQCVPFTLHATTATRLLNEPNMKLREVETDLFAGAVVESRIFEGYAACVLAAQYL